MRSRIVCRSFITLSVALSIACCGSNSKHVGGAAGSSGAAGAASVTPLTDKVVGKACARNSDCGNGVCATEFGANGLTGVMGTAAPGGYCTTMCDVDTDCGSTGICLGASAAVAGATTATRGQCYASCTPSGGCRDGYRCASFLGLALTGFAGATGAAAGGGGEGGSAGAPAQNALTVTTCQPAPATDKLTGSIAGAACTADTDCGAGRCMTSDVLGTSYPGGYCTGRCLQDSDCGADGSCSLGLLGAAGTCYAHCTGDSDCRDGYRCRTTGSNAMQCLPSPKPLAAGVVGSACTADATCGGASMSCVTGTMYPDGYCTQLCVDDSDCGAGGVCSGGLGAIAPANPSGNCYKSCAGGGACRAGYSCGSRPGVGITVNMLDVCIAGVTTTGDDAGVQ